MSKDAPSVRRTSDDWGHEQGLWLDRLAGAGLPVAFPGDPARSGAAHVPRLEAVVSSCDPATGEQGARTTVPAEDRRTSAPSPIHRTAAEDAAGRAERLLAMPVELDVVFSEDGWWFEGARPLVLTPMGRIRSVVRLASGPDASMTPADALEQVAASDIAHFLHARFDGTGHGPLTAGTPASPGAASGRIALSTATALDFADSGQDVILVREETAPDDVPGMQVSRAILTVRGGLASHAAVVARGWGIPAVVGASEVTVRDGGIEIRGRFFAEGDEISVDGGTGEVHLGRMSVASDEAPPELEVLLSWADGFRAGHVAVRANADAGTDARRARELGADGIGLCRTEHMFLAEDRLPLVRQFILADDEEVELELLRQLEDAQYHDFMGILEAMDGLPVTVRLLDPPLHEFLPDLEPLVVAEVTGTLSDEQRVMLGAVRRLVEVNPMIGTRGVRLGVIKPGLYPMQVRALCRAAAAVRDRGRRPEVEIMVPLVVSVEEMKVARSWIESTVAALRLEGTEVPQLHIGAMVETPRAALVAGDLSREADFFSFGTNDLTQLTYGLSRDDVEATLLPAYLEQGLLDHNPFDVLDETGVGRLVRWAVAEARAQRSGFKIGICGEQAGRSASIPFLVESGMDYVSCSPYRVPIARLAVAQALLDQKRVERERVPSPSAGVSPAPGRPPGGPEGDACPLEVADGPVGTRTAPTMAAAAPTDPDDEADEFVVLHALRVKGLCTLEVAAELSGMNEDRLAQMLSTLRDRELVRFVEKRSFWQLTPGGRDHHAALLPGAPEVALQAVRTAYDRFLVLNSAFKTLCTTWQVRDGAPNDHTDGVYDQLRIDELVVVHEEAGPVVAAMAASLPRLARYRSRLDHALGQVVSGNHKLFTGVMCGSFHDIWMELHEDLVLVLGIDRVAEGSF